MKNAREIIQKAIETIEEMNAKYCKKYGIENLENEIIKPFWCYSFGLDKVEIYKQALQKPCEYTIDSGIGKDAILDIKNRKHWEKALELGRV